MKELVVISGKGGTGKTSVTASLAVLAGPIVVADCDVDAADLHLILTPDIQECHEFIHGHEAVIQEDVCVGCGACQLHCRFDAIAQTGPGSGPVRFEVDSHACEGCGVCVEVCPVQAIEFPERVCGEWFVSETRVGPMIHARLGIGADNSGKLVSLVRRRASDIARELALDWVLVDGPPGIGCPVIASITGASAVLVVTEPTLSGEHDLKRTLSLTKHFDVPTFVCVNKWDINPDQADAIEALARTVGAQCVSRIPYDPVVTQAQVMCRAVADDPNGPLTETLKQIWKQLCQTV
ncbi:MAG: 4Fe-4S binding protein [Phycisphaeraceae bacterium]|nr:4Fe-4S binding protein [Phycisphaeraceae bacterium]